MAGYDEGPLCGQALHSGYTTYILLTCLYKSMMIIVTDQQKAKEIRRADMRSHSRGQRKGAECGFVEGGLVTDFGHHSVSPEVGFCSFVQGNRCLAGGGVLLKNRTHSHFLFLFV